MNSCRPRRRRTRSTAPAPRRPPRRRSSACRCPAASIAASSAACSVMAAAMRLSRRPRSTAVRPAPAPSSNARRAARDGCVHILGAAVSDVAGHPPVLGSRLFSTRPRSRLRHSPSIKFLLIRPALLGAGGARRPACDRVYPRLASAAIRRAAILGTSHSRVKMEASCRMDRRRHSFTQGQDGPRHRRQQRHRLAHGARTRARRGRVLADRAHGREGSGCRRSDRTQFPRRMFAFDLLDLASLRSVRAFAARAGAERQDRSARQQRRRDGHPAPRERPKTDSSASSRRISWDRSR